MSHNVYKFQVRSYKRSFKRPLITSQCVLEEREGLIVRLENSFGDVGFGEIAPMPFLGSESFDNAKAFCSQIDGKITDSFIESIDARLPCCRFGVLSAREMLQSTPIQREFEVAGLLSLADANVPIHYQNYKTFKCKIGSSCFEKEKEAFLLLCTKLPKGVMMRLDANGGLSQADAKKWLKFIDNLDECDIQFLEQPLAKGEEGLMIKLACSYRTSIAFDESVVNGDDFQRILENKWPGWIIVKPSLIGNIDRFRCLREECTLPIVYSSIFETAVGVEAALALAATDIKNNYALGFGTMDYFLEDGFNFHHKGPRIHSGKMVINDFEKIWRLCKIIR